MEESIPKDKDTVSDLECNSVYDLFSRTADKYSKNTAIQFMSTKVSYRDFKQQVDSAAKVLMDNGIHEGSIISFITPMFPAVIGMFLAANKLGAICTIIDYDSTDSQINSLLKDAQSETVLIYNNRIGRINNILDGTKVNLIIEVSANDYLSLMDKSRELIYNLKHNYMNSLEHQTYTVEGITIIEWSKMISGKSKENFDSSIIRRTDNRALYLHHSSLLDYKGIEVFNNRAIISACMSVFTDYKLERLAVKSRSAITIMNYAYNGSFVFAYLSMICSGISLLFLPHNDDVLELSKSLIRYQPSIIIGYPTTFTSLVETLAKNRYHYSNLDFIRLMIATGSSFVTTKRKFCEDFLAQRGCHIKISVCYGLTECLATGSYVPRRVDRNNSIGIPFSGVLMKVFDSGTLRELQPGEKGEICICSAGVLTEVLGDEVKTARIIKRHRDGRIWIHTGDIGHYDEDGYFYFDYVEKRCANISGISVSLKQIEDVIKTVYGVFDVCVVDYVNEEGTTCIVAQVVPIERYMIDNDLLNTLINNIEIECEMMLPNIARPTEIEYRAYLPRVGSEVDYKSITKDVIERRVNNIN